MDLNFFINILCSYMILTLFLVIIMSSKFQYKYNKYLTCIFITLIITLTYYSIHLTKISTFAELYIVSILIIILSNLFFKGNFQQISLICIVLLQFFLMSRILVFVLYYLLSILNNKFHNLDNLLLLFKFTPFLFGNIFLIFLGVYTYFQIKLITIRLEFITENKKIMNFSLVLCLINYQLLLYIFLGLIKFNYDDRLILTIVIVSIISLVFLLTIISLLKVIGDKFYVEFSNKVIEHQLNIQFNHYKNFERYITESRMIVHDTKHHILALDVLLGNNNIKEAKSYIAKLEDNLFALDKYKACENKLVDAIIQASSFNCSNKNISFDYDVIIPEDINIDYLDLSVIFGNLLTNSIESCENIKDKNINKFITLSAKVVNNNLIIHIKNSTINTLRKNTNGLFNTSKQNYLTHGIGLASVKHSISKYKGEIHFNSSKNIFEVKIIIFNIRN